MRRIVVPILALALLALPSQTQAQRAGRGGFGQQNQITAILQAADSLQLNLTPQQTTQLEALATRVDEANAPRLAQLQGGAGGGDFAALGEVFQAIQAENASAVEAARADVFTAAQWTTVETFVQSLGRGGRGGRGGRAGGGGGAPG